MGPRQPWWKRAGGEEGSTKLTVIEVTLRCLLYSCTPHHQPLLYSNYHKSTPTLRYFELRNTPRHLVTYICTQPLTYSHQYSHKNYHTGIKILLTSISLFIPREQPEGRGVAPHCRDSSPAQDWEDWEDWEDELSSPQSVTYEDVS